MVYINLYNIYSCLLQWRLLRWRFLITIHIKFPDAKSYGYNSNKPYQEQPAYKPVHQNVQQPAHQPVHHPAQPSVGYPSLPGSKFVF